MPLLNELDSKDLKEVTQTMARSIYAVFDEFGNSDIEASDAKGKKDRHAALHTRVFRALYDSGVIKDEEFNGAGLNEARRNLVTEFKAYHTKAQAVSKFYEGCVKPVHEMAPHFAMPPEPLVRMYCVAHYWKTLCKADSPFANMKVENGAVVQDEDCSEEEGEEEEESEEEEGEEEEGEEEEASEASDESDESEEEAEESEEEGEEEEPDPAEETAEEYAERNKYKNPMPPDFGLKGFDAEYARYEAKQTEKINKAHEKSKKRARN
jgi:hypothetical protein